MTANDTSLEDKPWLKRKDWARGEVACGGKTSLIALWIFAIFWLGLSSPLLFALEKELKRGGNKILIALIFPAVGVIMLIAAILKTIKFKKYGTSVFKMMSVPGAVGGTLAGVIQTNVKIVPDSGFKLHLRCLQRVTKGAGKNRRTEEVMLWEDYKTIQNEIAQDDPRRSGVPVFFEIPAHCAPTDKARKIFWRLEVSAEVPGLDFHTTFEVPVFYVREMAEIKMTAEEFAERFESPQSHPSTALLHSGVQVEDNGSSGTRFRYARAPHLATTLVPLIFFLGGAVGLYFLWNSSIPRVFAYGLGLFDLLFFWITFDSFLKSTIVEVDLDGMRVHTNRLLFERTRRVNVSEIQSIEARAGVRIGHTAYYEIRVRTRSESPRRMRTVTAGSGIKGRKEADWIVDKMYSALKLPRRNEETQTTRR